MAEQFDGFDDREEHGQGNDGRGGEQVPSAERRCAVKLSQLGWMISRRRVQRAVRRLVSRLPIERFEAWLDELARAAASGGQTHAATAFDRLAAAVDPLDRLSIDELSEAIGSRRAFHRLEAGGSMTEALPPETPQDTVPAEGPTALDPALAPFASSEFARDILCELHARRSAKGFDELLQAMQPAAELYPSLKPKYCDNGQLEFIRELRRVLTRRWGIEDLTAQDAASLLELDLVECVLASMSTRVRV